MLADMPVSLQVGSWLYMAPEMVNGHIYTEKVDVFSLAVMLFEALRGRLNILHIAMDGDPAAIAEYAHKVANGHRETVPSNWPAPVKALIQDAWHQVRFAISCTSHKAHLFFADLASPVRHAHAAVARPACRISRCAYAIMQPQRGVIVTMLGTWRSCKL